jgi:phosphocarrier protein
LKDKAYLMSVFNSKMKKKYKGFFVVVNEKGLHTRPSTELLRCAIGFKADVTLKYQQEIVNAKSLLGILILAADKGAKINVEAVGEDAEEAVEAILTLARNKFNINY